MKSYLCAVWTEPLSRKLFPEPTDGSFQKHAPVWNSKLLFRCLTHGFRKVPPCFQQWNSKCPVFYCHKISFLFLVPGERKPQPLCQLSWQHSGLISDSVKPEYGSLCILQQAQTRLFPLPANYTDITYWAAFHSDTVLILILFHLFLFKTSESCCLVH